MIDVHCHIPKDTFAESIKSWLQKWKKQGVKSVCSVAMDIKESKQSLDLAKKYRSILGGVGIHPWNVETPYNEAVDNNFSELAEDATLIGEIGLDYHFVENKDTYPHQRKVFEFMLETAVELDKPVTIHSKGAEKHIQNMVEKSRISPEMTSIHWYSGPDKYLKQMIKKGILFSITPAIHYSRHKKVAELVPIEQIMVESDGDVKYKGKLGHPGVLPSIIQEIAKIKEMDYKETNNIIFKNSRKFLNV